MAPSTPQRPSGKRSDEEMEAAHTMILLSRSDPSKPKYNVVPPTSPELPKMSLLSRVQRSLQGTQHTERTAQVFQTTMVPRAHQYEVSFSGTIQCDLCRKRNKSQEEFYRCRCGLRHQVCARCLVDPTRTPDSDSEKLQKQRQRFWAVHEALRQAHADFVRFDGPGKDISGNYNHEGVSIEISTQNGHRPSAARREAMMVARSTTQTTTIQNKSSAIASFVPNPRIGDTKRKTRIQNIVDQNLRAGNGIGPSGVYKPTNQPRRSQKGKKNGDSANYANRFSFSSINNQQPSNLTDNDGDTTVSEVDDTSASPAAEGDELQGAGGKADESLEGLAGEERETALEKITDNLTQIE